MPKPLTVWITTTVEKFKEMRTPDYLTCLLRNLYADQEATVRTGHGITDWFQIGKGVHQGCILSPCLFNLYTEYIMRNAGLDEAQAGIKMYCAYKLNKQADNIQPFLLLQYTSFPIWNQSVVPCLVLTVAS